MARPKKEGLDYFPLDVDIDQDDKIALIEAKHGLEGFAVVIKLLMKIYKNSYFYSWTEKEQLLFSNRVNVNINSLNDIINDCLHWDLFSKSLFDNHQILTSIGIQRRYLEAIGRRKEVVLNTDYLLVDPKSCLGTSKTIISYVNSNNNRVNVDINSINENINPQSKVKESKENKRYMDLSIHGNDFLKIYLSYFYQNFNKQHKQVSEENNDFILNQLEAIKEKVDIEEFEEIVRYHFDHLPANNDGCVLPFINAFPRYLDSMRSEETFD